MTLSEIFIAITLHLLIPAMGVVAYLILCRRLLANGASHLFLAQLFLLFLCYGGALPVILKNLFGKWSGMAYPTVNGTWILSYAKDWPEGRFEAK